jgi:hypothetical protein
MKSIRQSCRQVERSTSIKRSINDWGFRIVPDSMEIIGDENTAVNVPEGNYLPIVGPSAPLMVPMADLITPSLFNK